MERVVLAAVIVGATAAALALVRPSGAPDGAPDGAPGHSGWRRHPGTWLLAVTALLFVNQVLFTIHVTRQWGGDVSRLARFLPPGWFALADLGPLAEAFPAPQLLGWTVLSAQAALELPFVVLGYLTVCRWCGAEVFRRVVRVRWLVSAAHTATFCLIEAMFANPWTVRDVVVRVVAGLVVPPLLVRLGAGPPGPPRIGAFLASTGALGILVLAVYDTALLYNLAHLPGWLPVAGAAGLVLGAARWWARTPARPGPTLAAAVRVLGWFLALFAAPALAVRYGMNFGLLTPALVAAGVLAGVALWRGWAGTAGWRLLPVLGAVAVGAAAGLAPGMAGGDLRELRLLTEMLGGLLAGGLACVLLDRVRPAGPRPARPAPSPPAAHVQQRTGDVRGRR